MRTAEYPRPSHTLVHISDTHLIAPEDGLLYGVADATRHAERLLAELERMELGAEALVFTGDLADTGDPRAYRELRRLVEATASCLDAQVLWCMGNHDRRETFREFLLGQEPSDEPFDGVTLLGGLRVIVLDSTVPGHAEGEVRPDQLAWLAEVLAEPAPEGTLLAMHHPPMPCVQDMSITCELHGQEAFADVLRGTDVRAILAGHVHHASHAMFAGIPVSTATATSYTQDLTMPDRGTRGRDAAQGFNVVRVFPETIHHAIVEPGGGRTVGREFAGVASRQVLADEGIVIPVS